MATALLCLNFPLMAKGVAMGMDDVSSKKVTGTVVDVAGVPVIGANVMVKGTTNGTITDMDGKFTLEVPEGAVLQVSYIGYTNQEVVVGKNTILTITLKEDTQSLDEVVVVGYGTQKKVNLTGAVEQVTSEVFDNRSVPNVTQALQGSIPNLNMYDPDYVRGHVGECR